jgi:hypothetical protein
MKQTQKQIIAEKLEREGVIDNFWAFETKTTLRLGAIIERLRKDGWNIETKMVGKNCHYYLKSKPETMQGAIKQLNNLRDKALCGLFETTINRVKQDYKNF